MIPGNTFFEHPALLIAERSLRECLSPDAYEDFRRRRAELDQLPIAKALRAALGMEVA